MHDISSMVLALVAGIAIAAACGLRAFLPLFALGIAGRVGFLHLRPSVDWLTADTALWALGIATVLEIAGDKIPVVDHALDAVGTVIRPAAAWLGAYAVLGEWGRPWAQIAALVLGAGALAVQATKAKTRIGSTAATAGHANPVISTAEDAASTVLVVLAIVVPLVALVLLIGIIFVVRRWRRSRRAALVTS